MRRIILMAVLATIPFLAGMGTMQGPSSPDKIPVPAKQYHATFVDQTDVATECTEMTIDGAVYLEGKKGEGHYTISFENIEQVSFRLAAERLIGIVKLDGGGDDRTGAEQEAKSLRPDQIRHFSDSPRRS